MTCEEIELARRLQRLEDFEAARAAIQTYARTIDRPSLDTVLTLFAENAMLTTPAGTFSGIEEIRGFFSAAWAADPSVKRHFVIDQIPSWIDPGLVRVASYFVYLGRAPGNSIIGWGQYDHLVDVSKPEPKFRELHIVIDVATDLQHGWPQSLGGGEV